MANSDCSNIRKRAIIKIKKDNQIFFKNQSCFSRQVLSQQESESNIKGMCKNDHGNNSYNIVSTVLHVIRQISIISRSSD